jgi:transcriptional regulator with XRE-family HTH domain
MFGRALREAREGAGLSRGELRLRILRFFETAPSISAIRDIENGESTTPQAKNMAKFKRVLPHVTG